MLNVEQSTAIVFGMAMAIIALILLLAFLADWCIRLNAALAEDDEDDHAACIAHIADVVSNRFAAVVIRDLADRYDTAESRRVWSDLRQDWTHDGPSMPALWLRHHADERDKAAEA